MAGTTAAGTDYDRLNLGSGPLVVGPLAFFQADLTSLPVSSGTVTAHQVIAAGSIIGSPAVLPTETINNTNNTPTVVDLGSSVSLVFVVVPGNLQFSAASFNVAEDGGSATVTVMRVAGNVGSVSVVFATSNGTTTAVDYTAARQTLTFAAGETKTVVIPIVNDVLHEGTETVQLALSTPTGGAVLGSPVLATLNILDNDRLTVLLCRPPPALSSPSTAWPIPRWWTCRGPRPI